MFERVNCVNENKCTLKLSDFGIIPGNLLCIQVGGNNSIDIIIIVANNDYCVALSVASNADKIKHYMHPTRKFCFIYRFKI